MEILLFHKNKFGDKCGSRFIVDDEEMEQWVSGKVDCVLTQLRPVVEELVAFADSGVRPEQEPVVNFGYPLSATHPVQPLLWVKGVARFKPNAIVRHLLDNGPFDMNKLACMNFTDEDREQFAQLIGYSANGFAELSYVSDETYSRALAGRELR